MFCWEALAPGIHVDATWMNESTNQSNTVVDQVHLLMASALHDGSCPSLEQCVLTHDKDSSGMVRATWQSSKVPRSQSSQASVGRFGWSPLVASTWMPGCKVDCHCHLITMTWSSVFTSPVSGLNVLADWCIVVHVNNVQAFYLLN